MKKLTSHQLTLLQFFANGDEAVFCTSVSSQLGHYHFPNSKPEKFSKTVFFSLMRLGFVKSKGEEIEFGIRWSRVGISGRGLQYLNDLEHAYETV